MLFYLVVVQNFIYLVGIDVNGNWVKNLVVLYINYFGVFFYEKNDFEEWNFNIYLGLKFNIFDNLILLVFGFYLYLFMGNV